MSLRSTLLLLLLLPLNLTAEGFTPVQIALFEPFQLTRRDTSVIGFRFDLFYGYNENVFGLDSGLINITKETSGGLALGLVNASDNHYGVQAGFFNGAGRGLYGMQLGVINYTNNPYGIQFGTVNIVERGYMPMFGIFTNWSDRPFMGQYTIGFNQASKAPLQMAGILNNARESAVQIGLGLNFSDDAVVQFAGLWNYSAEGFLQMAPGLNLSNETKLFQLGGLANVSAKSPAQFAFGANSGKDVEFQWALGGNHATCAGTQISGIANVTDDARFQFAGFLNLNLCQGECTKAAQVAFFGNYSAQTWVQVGLVNFTGATARQFGAVNLAEKIEGSQIGILNRSIKTDGFMFGLINESHELMGFQIGLLNIARNASIPILPFFNSNYETRETRRTTGFINAAWTPLQLSLYSPGQIFTYETPVSGVRLNLLYGKSQSVRGIDLGFYNRAESVRGFELGAVNQVECDYSGVQLGGFNFVSEPFTGIQFGLGQYNRRAMTGFSLGGVVFTEGNVNGMQVGLLGNAGAEVYLPQLSGGFNIAASAPAQFGGLGNYSDSSLIGPQISAGGNFAKGSVNTQIGGLASFAEGTVYPLQISGIFNYAGFAPLQIAAVGNQATEEAYFQFAGVFNVVSRELRTAPLARGRDPYAQVSAFFNLSRGTYFQASAFNIDSGKNYFQAGAINFADVGHFQAGAINISFKMEGVQAGFVNLGAGGGLQLGAVNLAGDYSGVSIGAWNLTDKYDGFEIGLFNYARRLNGLQLGILNIHEKGSLPIMIGVNFGSGAAD